MAASEVNRTLRPRWHWAYPNARARCVFPKPLPPDEERPDPLGHEVGGQEVQVPAPELPRGRAVLEVERVGRLELDEPRRLDAGGHLLLAPARELPVHETLEDLPDPRALGRVPLAPGGEERGGAHELELGQLLLKRRGRHRGPPDRRRGAAHRTAAGWGAPAGR